MEVTREVCVCVFVSDECVCVRLVERKFSGITKTKMVPVTYTGLIMPKSPM